MAKRSMRLGHAGACGSTGDPDRSTAKAIARCSNRPPERRVESTGDFLSKRPLSEIPAHPQGVTGTHQRPALAARPQVGLNEDQCLTTFSFTISCLKRNTFGSVGSMIARTQCVSGKP